MTWTRRVLVQLSCVVLISTIAVLNVLNHVEIPGISTNGFQSVNMRNYTGAGVGIFPCDRDTRGLARSHVRGNVICPKERGFLQSIAIFNDRLKHEHMPGIVIQPVDALDIAAALQLAEKLGLHVTVKNGGHNPAGLCRQQGGMLIEMSQMKHLELDMKSMTIISEAGALWSDAHELIKNTNVTFVGGGCPSVGIAGLILGGGIGWLSRSRGLASDTVVSIEIVLKNGTVTIASAQENPDLFWALRGAGGSNFGVVTKVAFKIFPSEPEYFAGDTTLKTEDPKIFRDLMEAFLDGVQEIEDNGPSMWMVLTKARLVGQKHVDGDWGSRFHFLLFHDGKADDGPKAAAPVLKRLGPAHAKYHDVLCAGKPNPELCKTSGDESEAQHVTESFVSGQPFFKKHSFLSWSASMGATNVYMYWKSGFVEEITPELVDAALEALENVPDLEDGDNQGRAFFQFQVEHLGGAIAKFPEDHSAYSHRSAQLLWSIQVFVNVKGTVPASTDKYLREWSASTFTMLEPFFSGSYSNYGDPDLTTNDWQHRYYGNNYERLQDIKHAAGGFGLFEGRQQIERHAVA